VALRNLSTWKQAIDNLVQRLRSCAQLYLFVSGNRRLCAFGFEQANTPPQRFHGRVCSPAANRHAFRGSVFHDAIILGIWELRPIASKLVFSMRQLPSTKAP